MLFQENVNPSQEPLIQDPKITGLTDFKRLYDTVVNDQEGCSRAKVPVEIV